MCYRPLAHTRTHAHARAHAHAALLHYRLGQSYKQWRNERRCGAHLLPGRAQRVELPGRLSSRGLPGTAGPSALQAARWEASLHTASPAGDPRAACIRALHQYTHDTTIQQGAMQGALFLKVKGSDGWAYSARCSLSEAHLPLANKWSFISQEAGKLARRRFSSQDQHLACQRLQQPSKDMCQNAAPAPAYRNSSHSAYLKAGSTSSMQNSTSSEATLGTSPSGSTCRASTLSAASCSGVWLGHLRTVATSGNRKRYAGADRGAGRDALDVAFCRAVMEAVTAGWVGRDNEES